ncbi:methyltransferase domain-containing protein [Nocardia puris]|uniref:class I SAM-dependent methyltransferase n=1 Tax=Nocardia puris TaxID=208602 RepID=UPI001892F428|nr:class I SAM-dependent methyltransferase [Nocardia puris]MBF6216016.1 methyltransferase domain-containing protein [Nocardia puris]MBF6370234.1 methyltransferase domain-containing protein [Nocardia puris]MBF6463539.1 methyltransferase domain-containing protein [Nocardia puris]
MGIYRDQVVPRLVNLACGMKANDRERARVCSGLHGRVVEIGFGSGFNVPFYPEAVRSISAVEPADLGWKLAAKRLERAEVPIERAGLDGQALPFADNSFETALSTWTLCTIPDVAAALSEVRRVLVPGGTLHFVEHGLAPDAGVQTWQHRLNPIQNAVAGGCNLDRDIRGIVEAAGFEIRDLDVYYAEGPRFLAALSLGVAVSA